MYNPNPDPSDMDCPFCNVKCDVTERINDSTDNIITTYEQTCPDCGSTFGDRPIERKNAA